MLKRITGIIGFLFCGIVIFGQQWTSADSLHLKQILEGDGVLKLNPHIHIDFGTPIQQPLMSTDRPALKWDQTLPGGKRRTDTLRISLYPYKLNTPYNYDPIKQRYNKIGSDTWKHQGQFAHMFMYPLQNYGVDLDAPMPLVSVSGVVADGPIIQDNAFQTGYQSRSGAVVSGDFMKVFTKEFWNRKQRKTRERTLEVLKAYEDPPSK